MLAAVARTGLHPLARRGAGILARSLTLWLLLAIVPDIWMVGLRPWLADRPGQDTPIRAAEAPLTYLDCSHGELAAAPRPCLAADRRNPGTNPAVVFVAARWHSTAEPRADWTAVRGQLDRIRAAGALPVLILDGAPPELAGEPDPAARWGRDDPTLPSTWPDAFAQFAAEAVRELGPDAAHVQIGSVANGAGDGFPFPVHPVRYGQMAGAAAAAMDAEGNGLCLLSAPLRPQTPTGPVAMTRPAWLERFRQTHGMDSIGVLQLAPAVAPNGRLASDLTASLAAAVKSDRSPATSVVVVQPSPAMPGTGELHGYLSGPVGTGQRHCLFDRFGIGFREAGLPPQGTAPALGLVWLAAAILTVRHLRAATEPLRVAWSGRSESSNHRVRDMVVLSMSATVLVLCMASRNWLWTSSGLALLCGLAFVWPVHCWWLMLAALPFQQVHGDSVSLLGTSWISVSPAHFLLMALTPAVLQDAAGGWRSLWTNLRSASAAHWFGAVWFGLAAYGLALAPDTSGTQAALLLDWLPFGVFAATLQQARGQRAWQGGAVALVAGTCLFAVHGLDQWVIEADRMRDSIRLSGLTFSPNHAAMIVERGLWLAVALHGLSGARRARMVSTAVIALHGAALFATVSRGALLLGLPAGLLWMLATRRHTRTPSPNIDSTSGRLRAMGPVAACALAAGLLAYAWSGNFESLWNRLADAKPVLARVDIWQQGVTMIPELDQLGPGPDRFRRLMDRTVFNPGISPDLYHPHNVLLESLLRWGPWGLLPILFLLPLLWTGLRARSRDACDRICAGLAAALAAGLAHSLVDTFWMLPDVAAMNMALAGLLWTRTMPAQAASIRDGPRTRARYSIRRGSSALPPTKFRPTATTRRPEAK